MSLRSFFSAKLLLAALFTCALILFPASKLHAATLNAPAVVSCTDASATIMTPGPIESVVHYTVYQINSGSKSVVRSGTYVVTASTSFYTIWVELSGVNLEYTAYTTYQGSTSPTGSCTVNGAL